MLEKYYELCKDVKTNEMNWLKYYGEKTKVFGREMFIRGSIGLIKNGVYYPFKLTDARTGIMIGWVGFQGVGAKIKGELYINHSAEQIKSIIPRLIEAEKENGCNPLWGKYSERKYKVKKGA